MLHVTLDTSVLFSDPNREKAPFQALMKLILEGKIKLYLPEIVKREFISQKVDEYEKAYTELEDSIKSLSHKKLPTYIKENLEKIKNEVGQIKREVLYAPKQNFIAWEREAGAEEVKIADDDAQKVFESYFDGKPPFKSKRSRKDIPDAFIYETIKKLAGNNETIHAIINDTALTDACQTIQNVKTYKTIDDFVQSEDVRSIFDRIEKLEKSLPEIIELLQENLGDLKRIMEDSLEDKLQGKEFQDPGIPDDNNEATISGTYSPHELEFEFSETYTVGDEIIIIPFTAEVEAIAYYYICKMNYWAMDEEKTKNIGVTDHNDHYFEAEETLELTVRGTLRIHVNTALINDEIEDIYEIIDADKSGIDDITEIALTRDRDF